MMMFQSARPHGARHESSSFGNGSDVFQSARPHGARPSVISGCLALSPFQSARPHGARPRPQKGRCRRNRFNPHARTGRDHDLKKDAVVEIVSIRAPARGATRSFRKRSPCTKGFNPRARTGRDISMPHFTVTGSMFQSARPHGARRPRRRMTSARHQSFNPRARTGRDVEESAITHGGIVSIRAPSRGATAAAQDDFGTPPEFQSARPHGARQYPCENGLPSLFQRHFPRTPPFRRRRGWEISREDEKTEHCGHREPTGKSMIASGSRKKHIPSGSQVDCNLPCDDPTAGRPRKPGQLEWPSAYPVIG